MKPVLVESLTKDYGYGRGVFDISFSINQGEVFGFLGPNGAGKSTTIRHLMGFSKPDKGRTFLLGKESFSSYNEIMDKVGYLPGEIALPAGLTGWEFLDMMKKLRRIECDERLKQLVKRFDLDPSGDTKRMGLGVKRKLAVVAAFMHDPDILILDEPTSGLDMVMQEIFVDFIKEEKNRGKTILLSSHIFSEVDATCDRIAIIKDGKIVSDFIADNLRHKTEKNYLITFRDSDSLNSFIANYQSQPYFKITDNKSLPLTIAVDIDDAHVNTLIKALNGSGVTEFHHVRESLEDYFMKYYKEDKVFGGV